ncbi:Cation/H(+) antiporter 15 [Platanthera guangdongensis]|uniref:Cation/H(+) antiporter 15 n=1 Tax=Platanthera guangdongensis TaxID=2320717 RepID=A0ABR2LYN6_9ASPA
MSVIGSPIVNLTLVNPYAPLATTTNYVSSQGLFIGDNPLTFTLPLLLLEISIIFIVSNALHFVLKPLGQSRVVSQVLTGFLMGPSLIGHNGTFQETFFPARATFILDTLSLVSLTLFLFSIGVKTDVSLLKRPGWRAVSVGFCGSLLPIALSLIIYFTTRNSLSSDLVRSNVIIGIAVRLSLSSFAVIGDALQEHGLLNSDLGRTALSAALITDVCNWVIMSGSLLILLVFKAKSAEVAVSVVASLVACILFVFFVARPMAMWAIRRTPAGELVKEGVFVSMIVAALLASFATELFGFHATLGPIVLGLAIPGGMPIGVTLSERLDSFLSGLLLPTYLALAGYRTNLTNLGGWATWGLLEIIILTCFVGKFVGSFLAALYFKMPLKDAFVLGFMVNFKGIIEVAYINSTGDTEVLVEYLEKVVGDGEGTVGVVRGMVERFDVVVVGKRKGMEDDGAATKGIQEWSQCPELGVLGDMLAGVEIGGRTAILVVQQQAWAAGENFEGVRGE